MKKILFLFIITSSTFIFSQNETNEDRQGEPFFRTSNLINEIHDLLKQSYAYGHKSLIRKNDSLVHVNKNGARKIHIKDIDINSIEVKLEDSNYRVIIKCKNGKKKMIADWGKYNTFGFPLKVERHAKEVASKFRQYLSQFNF